MVLHHHVRLLSTGSSDQTRHDACVYVLFLLCVVAASQTDPHKIAFIVKYIILGDVLSFIVFAGAVTKRDYLILG